MVGDFGLGGPDILEEDRLAVFTRTKRFVIEVDVDAAREGEGDDEGRGHQVVRADRAVDAGFEVAVTREHGSRYEVALLDGAFDVGVERAGITDAGRATVADEVEAELVEVARELDLVEVIGDHAGTGG